MPSVTHFRVFVSLLGENPPTWYEVSSRHAVSGPSRRYSTEYLVRNWKLEARGPPLNPEYPSISSLLPSCPSFNITLTNATK
ncbi:hypothetical protein ACRALDRAFT_1093693 [Sodiomyces alcalophilus JCM 7366]|uniref:uncharacterized protein n=1 Tax=Sodiomyces alcalophilus JCM 7366 TaxID=591952 RepID=UPI0039B3F880